MRPVRSTLCVLTPPASVHQVMGVEELPMREKAALTAINHPFVLKLFNTYKNSKKLYLLMEFVPGGELYHRIHPVSPHLRFFFSLSFYLQLTIVVKLSRLPQTHPPK